MSIAIVAEIWRALKQEIDSANLDDAAESLINILIDNDFETAEIRSAFRGDSVVMDALSDYNSQLEDEEDYDDDEEDYEEDYDDDEY